MRKYRKLLWLASPIVILGISLLIIPSLRSQQGEGNPIPYPLEEIFSEEAIPPADDIKITIKEKLPHTIKPEKIYSVTWRIEGLKEEQIIEETSLHWAYLSNLENREEIEDYKSYPCQGQLFTWNQDEYTDEIYLCPSEVIPPAIMLVIHVSVDGKEYSLGPVPIDIVLSGREQDAIQ